MVLGKVRALGVLLDGQSAHAHARRPAFSGGDLVSGRVVVEVTGGDVRVRSLDVRARGVAKVRWTESRNAGANTAYTQSYAEELEYLQTRDTLIGGDADEDGPEEGLTVLHAGVHEFAFSFSLPQMALATSFEGKHGSVRYWVRAQLQRPWMLPVRAKKEFIVFEHIDINTPLLLAPQAGTKEKTLCCWFCASGPISLSAKIERKGYTPGESIQIFAEVENCSSRVVVPKAALYQTQTFFAKGKGKQVQQLVSNLRGEALPQGKSQSWEGRLLRIPPVSPSILDCPILRVEYALVTQTFFAKGKGKQIQQLVSNLRGEALPQGKSQSWEGRLLRIPPVSPSILDCPILRVEYALVTQTFFAKGKGKQVQQLVSNLRGEALPQGKSQSWEGRLLRIPPVSPSILDCPILRVEYALVVYVDVPGGLNLSLTLPLVIGTIPLHACASRTSSISSSGSAGWLLPERPEAPPSYSELAITESHRRACLRGCDLPEAPGGPAEDHQALLTYMTEFRYLPPPLYSEVDPYPETVEVGDVRRPDMCPSR